MVRECWPVEEGRGRVQGLSGHPVKPAKTASRQTCKNRSQEKKIFTKKRKQPFVKIWVLFTNSQNRQNPALLGGNGHLRHRNGAQDVCTVIPGLIDNVGKGVRCCDTRLCAMNAARAVGIDA